MEHKKKWDEMLGILLLALSAGLLGVSAFLCAGSDLWYDEVFTMGLASRPFGELVSITARDVHPPLYYMLVKLLIAVPGKIGMHQAAAAKLVSVLPFFFCLLYAFLKVKKLFGMFTAGLFSFLILTMPQLADYTVEVRMYGWALFFVTAGMLHAYEWVSAGERKNEDASLSFGKAKIKACEKEFTQEAKGHRKKNVRYINWCAMTGLLLAACYTHYFACVAAGMVYLYLWIALWQEQRLKEEGKAFMLSGLLCGAGYLPWVLAVVTRQVGQVKENYWIQPLSWRSLGGCVKFLFQPFFSHKTLNIIIAVLLFSCYAALFVWSVFRGCGGSRRIGLKDMVSRGKDFEGIKGYNAVRKGLFTQKDCGVQTDLWGKGELLDRRKAFFSVGCAGVLAGLVAFGFLASFLIRPVFVYRYMLPALGVFWLGFAVMVSCYLNKKYMVMPLMAFLLVIGLRNYRAFYGEEMWKKIQMDGAEGVFSQIENEDIVVCNFDQVQAMAAYYLPNEIYLWYGEPEPLVCQMYPQSHGLVEGEFSDEAGIRKLRKLLDSGRRVWFMGSGNARDEIIEKWERAGIGADEQASAMVERYWFNLYKIFYENE
ncbi:hypothetical protein [Parablautia muri]|nr:hypothetical protein [Parablautia muri]